MNRYLVETQAGSYYVIAACMDDAVRKYAAQGVTTSCRCVAQNVHAGYYDFESED